MLEVIAEYACATVIRQLAANVTPLPNLAEVLVGCAVSCTVDVTPFVAFANSLTKLSFKARPLGSGEAADDHGWVVRTERTLAALVKLEQVAIPELPNARCFLGVHRRLREITVHDLDVPGARFSAVVRATPSLVYAGCARRGAFAIPPGWAHRIGNAEVAPDRAVFRMSFGHRATV